MAFVFPSIDVQKYVRGEQFNFKNPVVAASVPIPPWTTTSTADYTVATGIMVITNALSSGGAIGTLDGVTNLAVGDRILLKDMGAISGTTGTVGTVPGNDDKYNGIWIIQSSGSSNVTIACVRDYDMQAGDVSTNFLCWVGRGTVNVNTAWVCMTYGAVINTTQTTYAQYDVTQTLIPQRGGTGVTSFGGTNRLLYTPAINTLSSLATQNNGLLVTDGSGVPSIAYSGAPPSASVQGLFTHNNLAGLTTGDPHTQYALLAGRSGGQNLAGDTLASGSLTLRSNSSGGARGTVSIGTAGVPDVLATNSIVGLTAVAMTVGSSTSLSVDLGAAGIPTKTIGQLRVTAGSSFGIDTIAAGTLNIAPAGGLATQIVCGKLVQVVSGSGGGIDVSPAGSMYIGQTSLGANTLFLANAAATTEVVGNLRSDLLTTVGAGTGKGIDTITSSDMRIGETNATSIGLYKTVNVAGAINTLTATTLSLGTATSNLVSIAASGVVTNINGNVAIKGIIDTLTGVTMQIGGTTATKVEIGRTGQLTQVMGDLYVSGTTTTVNSTVVNITDESLYLNAGYTTVAGRAGGLTVNYLPTTTTTNVAATGFLFVSASSSIVNVVSSVAFAVNDLIQVSVANNPSNNGLYCILSKPSGTQIEVGPAPNTSVSFVQTRFYTDTFVAGVVTKVGISVIRSSTAGDWQVAKGNASPLTYSTVATTGLIVKDWTFNPVSVQVAVTPAAFTTVGVLPYDRTNLLSTVASGQFSAWIDSPGKNAVVQLINMVTTAVLATLTAPAATPSPALYSAAIANIPAANTYLAVQVVTNAGSGAIAQMYGCTLYLSA